MLAAGFWCVSKTEARKNLCFLLYCLLPILLVLLLSLKMPLYIDRFFHCRADHFRLPHGPKRELVSGTRQILSPNGCRVRFSAIGSGPTEWRSHNALKPMPKKSTAITHASFQLSTAAAAYAT